MNLRRGFLRLSTVAWAFGAGLLFTWHAEVLQSPVAGVCTSEVEPPYYECLTDEARRALESGSLFEQLKSRVSGTWSAIDGSRDIPRHATARYRRALAALAWSEGVWALGIWGTYLVFVWIGAGFAAQAAKKDTP